MRDTAGLLEAPMVRKKPEPPAPRKPDRRWSPKAFGHAWRRAKATQPGFRTRHLSDPCGVDPATIRNWRKGVGKPDADQWMVLAAALGVDVFDLTESNT